VDPAPELLFAQNHPHISPSPPAQAPFPNPPQTPFSHRLFLPSPPAPLLRAIPPARAPAPETGAVLSSVPFSSRRRRAHEVRRVLRAPIPPAAAPSPPRNLTLAPSSAVSSRSLRRRLRIQAAHHRHRIPRRLRLVVLSERRLRLVILSVADAPGSSYVPSLLLKPVNRFPLFFP
jgi:hypothetical protein